MGHTWLPGFEGMGLRVQDLFSLVSCNSFLFPTACGHENFDELDQKGLYKKGNWTYGVACESLWWSGYLPDSGPSVSLQLLFTFRLMLFLGGTKEGKLFYMLRNPSGIAVLASIQAD